LTRDTNTQQTGKPKHGRNLQLSLVVVSNPSLSGAIFQISGDGYLTFDTHRTGRLPDFETGISDIAIVATGRWRLPGTALPCDP
jgi:hypothetical protein